MRCPQGAQLFGPFSTTKKRAGVVTVIGATVTRYAF
jgi:hypothetical protein